MTHKNDEANQKVNPSDLTTMGNIRQRSRYFKVHHPLLRRYLSSLVILCLFLTVFVSTLFYLNITHVYNLYSNVNLPTSGHLLRQKKVKNDRILPRNNNPERGLTKFDENIIYNDFNYLNSATLTYENRTYSNDIEILFRLPKKRDITALLLIFPGCGRSSYEWFHTIERQRIIGAAIDLGYGCIAFQTTDKYRKCWLSDINLSHNKDVQMVLTALEKFYVEYPKFEFLPRFTFGASSGGIFSSIFVTNQRYKIQGQILFISVVHPTILELHVKENLYPPTAWIYMLRDIEFASEDRINLAMSAFREENIPCIGYDIEPISLSSTTFHDRIPTITDDTSHYIYYRFQQNKWLDEEDYLKYNPRREEAWQTFLFVTTNSTSEGIIKNLEEHRKIIEEFLNTIYGEHEISFERSFEALTWHQTIYKSRINQTV